MLHGELHGLPFCDSVTGFVQAAQIYQRKVQAKLFLPAMSLNLIQIQMVVAVMAGQNMSPGSHSSRKLVWTLKECKGFHVHCHIDCRVRNLLQSMQSLPSLWQRVDFL